MYYGCHAEIPADVRRFILRETGERRVKRVSIALCNELAEEFFEFEEENERLKEFALHYQRRGEKSPTVQNYQCFKDAAVFENGRVLFARSIYDGLSASRD